MAYHQLKLGYKDPSFAAVPKSPDSRHFTRLFQGNSFILYMSFYISCHCICSSYGKHAFVPLPMSDMKFVTRSFKTPICYVVLMKCHWLVVGDSLITQIGDNCFGVFSEKRRGMPESRPKIKCVFVGLDLKHSIAWLIRVSSPFRPTQ